MNDSAKMPHTPAERLEEVLLDCCVQKILNRWEQFAYKPSGIMKKELAGVSNEWWYQLTTEKFKLQLEQRLQCQNPLYFYRPELELVDSFDLNPIDTIWGLAVLGDELFVGAMDWPNIEIFDKITLDRIRTLDLEPSVESLRDIAASSHHQCLYVIGEDATRNDRLSVVSPRTGAILVSWTVRRTSTESGGLHLAVEDSTGNVVVVTFDNIHVFTGYGKLVRTISLTEELDTAWQAIPLADGGFIVPQGWDDSPLHRVCRIDSDGKVVQSYGGERGLDFFSGPIHACLDPRGCVLVADSDNSRVRLLSPRLLMPLLDLHLYSDDEKCITPYRILLDHATGLLYVASEDGQLLIYYCRSHASMFDVPEPIDAQIHE